MVKFRWIKVFLLLILGLQITAVTGQHSLSFVVRDGDDVTLPCENVRSDQDKCDSTYWIYSGPGSTLSLMLVNLGQLGDNYEAQSDRLSVTEKCSLDIKKVTGEDAGRYTCRQLDISGQEDAHVYLSVVSMTEQKDADEVKLNCSVSTYEWCAHTVEWLFEGNDAGEKLETGVQCSVAVTFPSGKERGKSKCKVTADYSGEVQLFDFSPQSSGGTLLSRTTERSKESRTIPTVPVISDASLQGWWRFIIVSVGLAALIITVVVVNIWVRTKANKTQTDDNELNDEDKDDGTVAYENVGGSSAVVRLH